jgi:D-glycero-alpha-D-manno-heptose-7-phosphate kinase
MVITQTPFRMSFFGGGTDFPAYFEKYGGSVLSTTFDKYCYVIVRRLLPFFNFTNQITYSKIERTNSIDDIEHPAVREAMKYLGMKNMWVNYDADLPARSGLGSSSAFAIGLLEAFHSLKGEYRSKKELAGEAIHLERDLCKEEGGWQDQIAVSYGGFNRINFTSGGFEVIPLIVSKRRKQELNDNLMLFFTGVSRFSSDIAETQKKEIPEKLEYLQKMKELVDEAEQVLTSNCDIRGFGELLDTTWKLKKQLSSSISTAEIDKYYEKARSEGCIGGKLLGAGGGGFLLLFVSPEKQKAVREALSGLLYVPFKFEDVGTRVLYYDVEEVL